jgi:hypothetical protein
MSELYHPNIVLLMGVCFRKGAMAMVTELMPEGSVSDLLRNPKANISLLQKLAIARDTSLGMNWLHTRNPTILHRDLKPANLLMDKDWNVKVCDFGLSTAVERGKMWEDEDDIPGTPLWMAPEVMLGKALGPKSDVYSFGLCLWEFFSCQEPYQAFTNFNDFRRAVCFKFERPKLVPATVCPEAISKLIVRCWDSDPNVRPSFAELLDLYPALFLECMISDEKGKEFWSQAFYHDGLFPAEVGWDQFALALAKYLGLADSAVNDTALLCLKALIAEDSRKPGIAQVVTLQTFGEFLQEFGPLVPRPERRADDARGAGDVQTEAQAGRARLPRQPVVGRGREAPHRPGQGHVARARLGQGSEAALRHQQGVAPGRHQSPAHQLRRRHGQIQARDPPQGSRQDGGERGLARRVSQEFARRSLLEIRLPRQSVRLGVRASDVARLFAILKTRKKKTPENTEQINCFVLFFSFCFHAFFASCNSLTNDDEL